MHHVPTLVGYRLAVGGVMRARLLWALLVLGAVFSMHGLSCTDSDAAMANMPSHATPDQTGEAGPGLDSGTNARDSALPQSLVAAPTWIDDGQTGDGHGAMAHALMVCMAVLAGGIGTALAVLASWLSRRRLLTVVPRPTVLLRSVLDHALPHPAPPELSRLCVLRV